MKKLFILHLQPTRNEATSIRGLQWLLKNMWRHYGVRCISAEETQSFVHEHEEPPE
jgi:hypothetical protein